MNKLLNSIFLNIFIALTLYSDLSVAQTSLTRKEINEKNVSISKEQEKNLIMSMKNSALDLIDSLNHQQKSETFLNLNNYENDEWRYFPDGTLVGQLLLQLPERKGLSFQKMTKEQINKALILAQLGLSKMGTSVLYSILKAETDQSFALRGIRNKILFEYSPLNYYISIFGSPDQAHWGWKLEGHHFSLKFLIQDDRLIMQPLFIGTNPEKVTLANGTVVTPLANVNEKISILAQSLTQDQKNWTRADLKNIPEYNLFAPGLKETCLNNHPVVKGLSFQYFTSTQQVIFSQIIHEYLRQMNSVTQLDIERTALNSLISADVIFLGDVNLKKPFYFKMESDQFILELMNSDKQIGHFHSVWINKNK